MLCFNSFLIHSNVIYYLVDAIYSPILVDVPIEFAFEVAAIVMVADYHDERRSTVTAARQSDQPILGLMVTAPTNRSTNLNACLNDVAVDRPMHGLNVAYDEHLHDESQMAHRIYTVKENCLRFA